MANDVRARLVTVLGLAALGVTLAAIGTAIGVTGAVTGQSGGPEFIVSDRDVTVSTGDREATVVGNITGAESIEIERVDAATFRVDAERDDPLTAEERERAVAITRDNDTVRRLLDDAGDYDLEVDPVYELKAGAALTANVSLSDNATGGEATWTIENVTIEDGDGSVRIDRDPPRADDEVVVRIREPGSGDVISSITVDLANETVVSITEWGAIRSDSAREPSDRP